MQFQVTEIEFDLTTDDDTISESEVNTLQQELQEEIYGTVWEVVDEDDLIEEITTATGWCITSIAYRQVLV